MVRFAQGWRSWHQRRIAWVMNLGQLRRDHLMMLLLLLLQVMILRFALLLVPQLASLNLPASLQNLLG